MAARLPSRSGGALQLTVGPVTLEVTSPGVRDVRGTLARRALVFRDARPHADSFLLAEADRVEEFTLLRDRRAPRRLDYRLRVVQGGGRVRQQGGVVEVLDAAGIAWLRLGRPYVVDADGKRFSAGVQLKGQRLTLRVPPAARRYPILVDPGWFTTTSMTSPRREHSMTLLVSGKVLIAGGHNGIAALSTAELFDPATMTFTSTKSMTTAHQAHTATRLSSGKVLVAGGLVAGKAAELYDPTKGSWSATGSMASARSRHSATVLGSGAVLVVGGTQPVGSAGTAELYSPTSGWSAAGEIGEVRYDHSAVLLPTGKVLVVGGFNGKQDCSSNIYYDPATNKWSGGIPTPPVYSSHTATAVPSAKFLYTGGCYGGTFFYPQNGAILFDPVKNSWNSLNSLATYRCRHTAVLLSTGKVLVAGGYGGGQPYYTLASAELVDPACDTSDPYNQCASPAGTLKLARHKHRALRLATGVVLVTGGQGKGGSALASAELYDPTTGSSCSSASTCLSGHCVDGICCNTKCMEQCKQCVAQNGVGQCVNVAAGKQDLIATVPCSGSKTCDGKGVCGVGNGQACSSATACGSGNCIDGVCCSSACTAACHACNLVGSEGKCTAIPSGQPDPKAATPASTTRACDGKGACKYIVGQTCSVGNQCVSDHCTDGFCCDAACKGTCRSCALTASKGSCGNIPAGLPDLNASTTCSGIKSCDGQGHCAKAPGQSCGAATECGSGHCVDGVCCSSACNTPCRSCGLVNSLGKCTDVPAGKPDPSATVACSGSQACDGKGGCKKANGQSCAAASECGSGNCVDGACCDLACTATCYGCAVGGNVGKCLPLPAGASDTQALVACSKGQTCDGKGVCKKANGQACTGASECSLGFCTDYRCCDKACSSVCWTCAATGSAGKCIPMAAGKEDTTATTPCTGSSACDGKGSCRKATGQACASAVDCGSGFCVDGYCCKEACSATCMACNVPGKEGSCLAVPAGTSDPQAASPCAAPQACDGKGICKKASGQSCSAAADCGSGFCTDGVCCDKACSASCMSCSTGSCGFAKPGSTDSNGIPPCSGTQACDGAGGCKKASGQSCSAASECGSGHCVDGYCCKEACSATCMACGVVGKEGTCSKLAHGKKDSNATTKCTGVKVCDGKGNCLLAVGQDCTDNADCANSTCVDDVCCATACDKDCESCALAGNKGTCTAIKADIDPDKECIGKVPRCGGVCDGKRQCMFPGVGRSCGKCMACDGAGGCNSTPPDDPNCGVIDCDQLDTKCRDYRDLNTNRCGSLGQCKKANDPSSCTSFVELCATDAGPDTGNNEGGSGGAQGEEESGCSLAPASRPGPAALLAGLLLLGVLWRRRRDRG